MVYNLTVATQRLQEGADRTSINTYHLACTWKVEMKGEDSIREEGDNERRGRKTKRKNIVALRTEFVIKPESDI